MNHSEIAELRRQLREDNETYPDQITRLPDDFWQSMEDNPPTLKQMWRSKSYQAQVHDDGDGIARLAICRNDLDSETGRPLNDIPFKVLLQLKSDMGYGDQDGTILLPRNEDWADFSGFTTIYIHPFPVHYGFRKEQAEKPNNLIIIPR